MTEKLHLFALLPGYCLIATLLMATLSDVLTHRIPNALLMPALSIALLIWSTAGGAVGLWMSLSGMGVGLAMLLPIYAMGAMGAGDVKLLGVAGAFLGPHGALIAGLMTFIAGAFFGLLWIGWRKFGPCITPMMARYLRPLRYLTPLEGAEDIVTEKLLIKSNNSFAYAPAIATGAVIAISQQGWMIPMLQG
jgi:Flp pilus assembly protein protease CpaA